jgi:hypothetical protein
VDRFGPWHGGHCAGECIDVDEHRAAARGSHTLHDPRLISMGQSMIVPKISIVVAASAFVSLGAGCSGSTGHKALNAKPSTLERP